MKKTLKKFLSTSGLFIACISFLVDTKLVAISLAEEMRPMTSTTVTSTGDPIYRARKEWTLLVYLAANNNLQKFALKNLTQMLSVGSTEHINVVVQLDELGAFSIYRYYITKGLAKLLDVQLHNVGVTSGTPESLYNFIKWGIQNFPSDNIALDLWNHGSGIKDPNIWGKFLLKHRDDLYVFNSESNYYELDHQIRRHRDIKSKIWEDFLSRGIAFNDTFHTYLTNQDLKYALEGVVKNEMGGRKFDVLCMDACHMAMIEVGSQIKNTAKFMVGSQEVEPGGGYNYEYVLAPFADGSLSPEEFAKHIVKSYDMEYQDYYSEYTQSAYNLTHISKIEDCMALIAKNLSNLLKADAKNVGRLLKTIRNSNLLTQEFYDKDYIDLVCFLKNLDSELSEPAFTKKINANLMPLVAETKQALESCLTQMQNFIIQNAAGTSLPEAFGVSLYYPKHKIHDSYFKTIFDQITNWSGFLRLFVDLRTKTHAMAPAK